MGRRITARAPKSPQNVTSTFFNTVNLLPKELRFEYAGAKFASCPGRHITSLRPCASQNESNGNFSYASVGRFYSVRINRMSPSEAVVLGRPCNSLFEFQVVHRCLFKVV